MRKGLLVLVPLLLLFGVVLFMVFSPASTPSIRASAVSSAEAEGWSAGGSDVSEVGPFGLVKVSQRSWERDAPGGITLGKFYVIGVKAPVWLPRSVIIDLADEQLRSLAVENGVALTPVTPAEDPAGAEVREYSGRPSSGSVFDDEVGVLLRALPCDFAGNVVLAVGFGAKEVATGPLGPTLRVYDDEVKRLLAPAVACP